MKGQQASDVLAGLLTALMLHINPAVLVYERGLLVLLGYFWVAFVSRGVVQSY